MLDFRKATINDLDDLAKIRSIFLMEMENEHSETKREKMEAANRAYFEKSLADDSFVAWLAVADGKIVGTSGLSFYIIPPNNNCPDGRVANIMNMFTFPEYRKQGIATELFKRIVEEAKLRGYKRIALNATSAGKPLYEKYGFKDAVGDMIFHVKTEAAQ